MNSYSEAFVTYRFAVDEETGRAEDKQMVAISMALRRAKALRDAGNEAGIYNEIIGIEFK